ncbi:MAG: class II aldolase/adducin family protein [Anaerolineae bacterium]|nr:class II aldolase/adducin family protein [Anaerolineae bacterium]
MLNYLAKISNQAVSLVNSQQKVEVKTRDILVPRLLRKSLIEIAHQASNGGLSVGLLEEISARITDERFVINALNTSFKFLDDDDFIIADVQGLNVNEELQPARHMLWHRFVYKNTPAKYVLYCQPRYATGFANQMLLPQAQFLADAADSVGGITCVLPEDNLVRDSIIHHHAVLIKGHGLLVWAEDVKQILARAEVVERWCVLSRDGM